MEEIVLETTHALDNVAVAVDDIPAGTSLTILTARGPVEVQALEDIPFGEPIATRTIRRGQPVVRGGVQIGVAVISLRPGQRVDLSF
jgi:altronate dehydratase small subunit